MKRSWKSKSPLVFLLSGAIALLWSPGIGSAGRARTQPENVEKSTALAQQLGAEGQASLRATVQAGNLADLRWPDFSDYENHVQKFYESYGYSLPWVRGMEPTPEARQSFARSPANPW